MPLTLPPPIGWQVALRTELLNMTHPCILEDGIENETDKPDYYTKLEDPRLTPDGTTKSDDRYTADAC